MKNKKIKIIRITTVPESLVILLKGQLNYMQQYFEMAGVSSLGKLSYQVSENEKIRFLPIEMTRTISPIKDLISLLKLIVLLRNEKPQIVHTHTPKAGTIGMLAAWLCRVPIRMHTVAGLPLMEVTGFKRKLLDFVEKITYSCATKVYPNSFGLKSIILQNSFCKDSKILVIGNGSSNGIDTDYFSKAAISPSSEEALKHEYQILPGDFVYIFVGRIVADKGINELVKAFNEVSRKHPSAKLILVGNRESELDPLQEETELILQKHPAIIQTGYQSDVRPFLSIADVLTFPSYREGFPNVVMQAGAMGLPSIVTNINGCNEIIQDNVNGIIVPSKNIASLENAMNEIFDNDEKRDRLAKNSRSLIIARFEQKKVWQLIKQEYDEQLRNANISF